MPGGEQGRGRHGKAQQRTAAAAGLQRPVKRAGAADLGVPAAAVFSALEDWAGFGLWRPFLGAVRQPLILRFAAFAQDDKEGGKRSI